MSRVPTPLPQKSNIDEDLESEIAPCSKMDFENNYFSEIKERTETDVHEKMDKTIANLENHGNERTTISEVLPPLLEVNMPAFERSYKNTILRPLTSVNTINDEEGLVIAASILRPLMRCVYVRAKRSLSRVVTDSSIYTWGDFSDTSSADATKSRLLPKTINFILSLKSDDASSSSRRNHQTNLTPKVENTYFQLLLDFVELTVRILNLARTDEEERINALDYLGPDWLEIFCKVLGDLHYWEYNEDDWKGGKSLIGERNRNSCALSCFYRFYGHNRIDQELNEVKAEKKTYDRSSLFSTLGDNKDCVNENEIIISVTLPPVDAATSVSSYLLAAAKYFIEIGGLKALTNAINNNSKLSNNSFRLSLTSTYNAIKIVRAIAAILWSDEPTDAEISVQISRFRDSFLYHITSLLVGIDIITGEDRQIIFSLLDSMCEHPNQSLQNSLVSKLTLDWNISRKLRLDTIWKLLYGCNTTLQSRIYGLNEIRSRISDAVQELDEARHRVEEFDSKQQERIRNSKDQPSPRVIAKDVKMEAIPRLEIPHRSATTSPTNSQGDNLSTTVYIDDETSHQQPELEDDNDDKWMKTDQNDKPSSISFSFHENETLQKVNHTLKADAITMKRTLIPHASSLDTQENQFHPRIQENELSKSFESFLVESAEQEISYLISFLTKEHSFLSTLLSPSYLHPELLKRLIYIPSFLAEQGELSSDDIKTMWSAAMTSSHESIQHAVYELLIGLVDKFEKEQLLMLGKLFETMEYHLISEKYLVLVHHFASVSLGVVREIGDEYFPLGADLLWTLGQESTPLKTGLHETVISYLLNLTSLIVITGNDRQNRRKSQATADMSNFDYFKFIDMTKIWLIENAVRGIKHGKSSVPCQLIINSVLRLWPLQESNQFNVVTNGKLSSGEKLENKTERKNYTLSEEMCSAKSRVALVKEYDLVTLVVNDLCRYVQYVKEVLKEDKSRDLAEIDNIVVSGQCYSHAVNVSSRFEFLKFILGICFNAAMEEHRALYAVESKLIIPSVPSDPHSHKRETDMPQQNVRISDDSKVEEDVPIIKITKIQSEAFKLDAKESSINSTQNEDGVRIVTSGDVSNASSIQKPVEVPIPIHNNYSSLDPIIIEDDDDSIKSVESKQSISSPRNKETKRIDKDLLSRKTKSGFESEKQAIRYEGIVEASKRESQGVNRSNLEQAARSISSEIITQKSSPLSTEHIELLWINFVENCSTPQESALCLSALHSILATSQCCLSIRMQLAPILFHFCSNRLAVLPMRSPAFDLFALAMTSCNLIHGKYELYVSTSSEAQTSKFNPTHNHLNQQGPQSSASDSSIQVRLANFNVLGIDKLWQISLYARDEEVAKKAMSSLSTIYTFQSISDVLRKEVPIQQRLFVQSCMSVLKGNKSFNSWHKSELENGVDSPEKMDFKSKVRCLKLISIFADAILRHATHKGVIPSTSDKQSFSYKSLPTISHGHTTSEQSQNTASTEYFNVRVQPTHGISSFQVICSSGSTVGYLRNVVRDKASNLVKSTSDKIVTFDSPEKKFYNDDSDQINCDWKNAQPNKNSEYRLIYQGKELLSNDDVLLSDCGIVDGTVVHCCPRSNIKNVVEKHGNIIDIDDKSISEKRKRIEFESNSSTLPKELGKKKYQTQQQSSSDAIVSSNVDILTLPEMAAITELIQPQHIDAFFSLLCVKISKEYRELRELVWDILQLLPTDPNMRIELRALRPCPLANSNNAQLKNVFRFNTPEYFNWNRLLPPLLSSESSFRLLYSLQHVQSLIADSCPKDSSRSSKKLKTDVDIVDTIEVPKLNIRQLKSKEFSGKGQNWSNDFFSKGGVAHLINILLDIDGGIKIQNLENDDPSYLDEFLFSSNLLYILRCINRLQQLVVFFLETSTELLSNLTSIMDKESVFGPLLHHTLKMIDWSVSIQKRFWGMISKNDVARMSRTHDGDNVLSNQDLGFAPASSVFGTEQISSSGGTFFDSDPFLSASITAKKKIPEDVCVESGSVLNQSLKLLRLLASTAPFPTLVSNLIPSKTPAKTHPSTHELLSNALASALVKCPCNDMRKLALNTFQSIFVILTENKGHRGLSKTNVATEVLAVLIDLIPLGLNDAYMEKCSHLFDVICDLMIKIWGNISEIDKMKLSSTINVDVFDIEIIKRLNVPPPSHLNNPETIGKLFNWIIGIIIAVPIREQRRKRYPIDSFLVGLFKLTEKILQLGGKLVKDKFSKNSDVFIRYVFYQCLFSFPSAGDNGSFSAPKCKTLESRESAFNVLRALCEDCLNNVHKITQLLLDSHHSYESEPPRRDLLHEWHFDPISRDKGSTGHVGLRNLGATCYLNSLLQQFFLIEPLRNGLLSCEKNFNLKANESENELLHQLQLLFANLLLSERKDYDTSELCSSIKGYDGNPIRPGEQQDVVEFFNLFGDRLETCLKSFDQRFLLQDVFGGKLSHIVTCQECKHSSERSEDCLSLSLDVKGKSNVLESLKLYIQGEALDGDNQYYCEKCQAKRDSLKMCCVSSLPNNLILHLKRFEFDLELMRKIKVNDRFEYPLELNMKPFTKEAQDSIFNSAKGITKLQEDGDTNIDKKQIRPDSYYQYYLRGILVHSGTADSGHYYSLAKEGGNFNEPSLQPWFCFNDSSVTPFDLSTLPSATFGGIKVGTKYDHLAQKMVRTETPKPYSAYLLIYERKNVELGPKIDTLKEKNEREPHNNLKNDFIASSAHHTSKSNPLDSNHVPEKIFNELWKKNDQFLRDRVIFSPEYCKWLLEITRTCESTSKKQASIEMVQAMTHFLLETLIHGKDCHKICEKVVFILCDWYRNSVTACKWLLQTMTTNKKFWVEKILLNCPIIHVRKGFVKLLSVVFQTLAPHERDLYAVEDRLETRRRSKKESDEECFDENSADLSDVEEIFDMDDDLIMKSCEGHECMSRAGMAKRKGRSKWWKSSSFLARFVGSSLLELLPQCEKHWRRFDQLFEAILSFASIGHEEALYLIRCGVILRLVDIYLGDRGGVPQKSLMREMEIDRNTLKTARSKMGDKYTKPNLSFLFSILNTLIRSAVAIPEEDSSDNDEDSSDDDFDDSEDDTESMPIKQRPLPMTDQGEKNMLSNPPTLSSNALEYFNFSRIRYELPRRDLSLISTKQFLKALLEESSIPGRESESTYIKAQKATQVPQENIVTSIVCHICFNNMDLTKLVCEITRSFLEDRKADEFFLALETLLSILKINDECITHRIHLVMDTLAAGIVHNLTYEKESTVIINGLKDVLDSRIKGIKGSLAEVSLHRRIMDCLENDIFDWFSRENTSGEVRQSIIFLMQSLLPKQDWDDEAETISSKLSPEVLESDMTLQSKLEPYGKSKSNPIAIDSYESDSSPETKINESSHQSKSKCDEDVVVLGVVRNSQSLRVSTDSKKLGSKKGILSHSKKSVEILGGSMTISKKNDINQSRDSSLFPYASPKEVKKELFHNLIDMFGIVSDALQSQASQRSSKVSSRNSYSSNSIHGHFSQGGSTAFVDSSAFAVYFETLRLCLTGAEYEKKALQHQNVGFHGRLMSLLWKIDEEGRAEQRPSADIAKGEIIKLYRRMMELHRCLGKELIRNFDCTREVLINIDDETSQTKLGSGNYTEQCYGDDAEKNSNKLKKRRMNFPDDTRKAKDKKCKQIKKKEPPDHPEDEIDSTSKLLEIYVTSMKDNESYNAKYMHHYYELLMLLANRHNDFKRKMLDHNNWRWSLKAFVLGSSGQSFGLLTETIFEGTIKYVQEDENFRNLIVSELVTESYEGGKKSLLTQVRFETRTISLFCTALKCVESGKDDIIYAFINDHRGMHQLSFCINKFHKMIDDEKRLQKEPILILEGLSLSLESLWTLLKAVGVERVRGLILKWDEADDINFLCCQLVTSEKKEWDSLLDEENEEAGQREYERIIDFSSDILSILASIETILEPESGSEHESE